MTKVKAKLKKTGICPYCSHEAVISPIGTEYEVDLEKIEEMKWICGGCHHMINIKAIMTFGGVTNSFGFLPLDILQIDLPQ